MNKPRKINLKHGAKQTSISEMKIYSLDIAVVSQIFDILILLADGESEQAHFLAVEGRRKYRGETPGSKSGPL